MTRILLVHAFLPSMAPIVAAFAAQWPEAQVVNMLDESIYADVTPEGVMTPDVPARVADLLRLAEKNRADGIVFTGSTFGPAVDAAKGEIGVPVLKADEAMAEVLAARPGRTVVVCTAARALPVIRANIIAKGAEIGTHPEIDQLWVEGAKDAISAGNYDLHDRLVAAAIEKISGADTIALGQLSMVPAKALLSPEAASRVMTSADAAVARLRDLIERHHATDK